MAKFRIGAWGVAAALLLTGCGDNSPVVSGEVRAAGSSHSLSERQLTSLNAWLGDHRSGWGLVLATPPNSDLWVVVKRADGKSGNLFFYSQEGWKGALTYFGSDAKENEQGSFPIDQVRALRDVLASTQ